MNKNFDKFKRNEQSDKQLLKYGIKKVPLRLGHLWEYKDEKAFVECQKILESRIRIQK